MVLQAPRYSVHLGEDTAWAAENIPLFECPDPEIEEIYYFRWRVLRRHIKETPDGIIITEFLPRVSWSGKHNSIVCPAGHHYREARWLHDRRILDDYSLFWFRRGGEPRTYSTWLAHAVRDLGLFLPGSDSLSRPVPHDPA